MENGGSAFPFIEWRFPDGTEGVRSIQRGMSLRDWFAGQALLALTQMSFGDGFPHVIEMAKRYGKSETEIVASMAYEFADAMLKAREQTP